MLDITLGSPWSSLRKRVSKYPIATSETNIWHYIILMSSWQFHSVGNGSAELQELNWLRKLKTEIKDRLGESYMKSRTPKKYLHSISARAVKKQQTSSLPKQRSRCCPSVLISWSFSLLLSYNPMSLKKQILPFCYILKK